MEKAGTIWSRRRSWTAIALVLAALALLQACGDSSKGTGPSSGSAVQLKLRRVSGAEIPANCSGVYSVSGPGVNIVNKALPESGKISFQGSLGQTYFVSVQLTCGLAQATKLGLPETLSGSTSVTLGPGTNEATIVLQVSKVLGLSCNSPVAPGETSKCTCSVQSPGPASIGWQGATPTGSNTANFSNNTPGSYPVTCTLNGVAVATTTVQVVANSIKVTVTNTGNGCCSFFARFVGKIGPTEIFAGESKTFDVPPGSTFQAACTSSFGQGQVFHEQVVNSSTTISLNGGGCG